MVKIICYLFFQDFLNVIFPKILWFSLSFKVMNIEVSSADVWWNVRKEIVYDLPVQFDPYRQLFKLKGNCTDTNKIK